MQKIILQVVVSTQPAFAYCKLLKNYKQMLKISILDEPVLVQFVGTCVQVGILVCIYFV